jgi:hypothetical protein
MTATVLRGWPVLLVFGACALPAYEVDDTLGGSGSGGGGSGGGAGSAQSGTGGTGLGKGGSDSQAGAGPDDEREPICQDYCNTYILACAGHEANTYDDVYDCLLTCASAGWPLGTDPMGPNSLQCRRQHAIFAIENRNPHCYHSAEFPSMGVCEAIVE